MNKVKANHEQPCADRLHISLMARDSRIKFLENHNLNLTDENAELRAVNKGRGLKVLDMVRIDAIRELIKEVLKDSTSYESAGDLAARIWQYLDNMEKSDESISSI